MSTSLTWHSSHSNNPNIFAIIRIISTWWSFGQRLFGLLLTSRTGAKLTEMPIARHSFPTSSPYSYIKLSLRLLPPLVVVWLIQPRAIFFGNRTASVSLINSPHSLSVVIISGTFRLMLCANVVRLSCEDRVPLENKSPPTWYLSMSLLMIALCSAVFSSGAGTCFSGVMDLCFLRRLCRLGYFICSGYLRMWCIFYSPLLW